GGRRVARGRRRPRDGLALRGDDPRRGDALAVPPHREPDPHPPAQRAVRSEALPTLDLHSTGMEFASEMVFKAFRRKLRVSEIPIDYYPRVGESKLNRFGDAWRHVKFMLLYSPSWLFFVPGLVLLALGSIGALALAAGPVEVLGRTWQIHTLFHFMFAILLGTQVVQLGIFARAFAAAHLGETDRLVGWARGRLSLEHGLVLGGLILLAGILTVTVIFVAWALDGFGALAHEYATALGFTLIAVGTQVVLGSFFIGLLTMRTTEPSRVTVLVSTPDATAPLHSARA